MNSKRIQWPEQELPANTDGSETVLLVFLHLFPIPQKVEILRFSAQPCALSSLTNPVWSLWSSGLNQTQENSIVEPFAYML